jgi:hypothetical protein
VRFGAGRLPGFLASPRWRIFLVAWLLFSVHFATNIVREHYPAFSIAEHGTFRVDEYAGFHADIFVHRDGHAVIGNQVFVSVLAAVPLFLFDPILDALERHSLARIEAEGVGDTEYRVDKPKRREFFKLVRERGLDLRFGGAAVVTSVFFMAPLTAFFLVYFFDVLGRRGVPADRAAGLTFLLGFATPLFYRTSVLNHNMFIMFEMFAAFVLLWPQPGDAAPLTVRRRFLAGLWAGLTLATDYIGVIIIPLLFAYYVLPRRAATSWSRAIREALPIVAGLVPPVAFLLYSQWAMYGNPFWPGQHWMPDQNIYVHEGVRGFTLPDPELFLLNLFDPGYGLFVWGPLLALAFVPVGRDSGGSRVLPRRERLFVMAAFALFMLFNSSNQYSRLQWNSGFRYLIPMVPFLVLALADVWLRLSRPLRLVLTAGAVLHSWVLTVYREFSAFDSWKRFAAEGPQLPWLRVLRMTSSPDTWWVNAWWVPVLILALTLGLAAVVWRSGPALEGQRT